MSMIEDSDDAPGRGHNSGVDFAKEMTAELARDYSGMFADSLALYNEAKALIEEGREIADEDSERAGVFAALYKRISGHGKVIIAKHDEAKLPHKTRADTVDSVFFGDHDRLLRRDKKAKPGIGNIIYACFDDWNQRKLAREQAARDRIAAEARRVEQEAFDKAAAAARAEREAIEAADRARAPAQITKKNEIAIEAGGEADAAHVDHVIAQDKVDAAVLATKAKPADMVRERFDEGVTGTMQTEKFAEIVDRKLLDKDALWPFLKTEVLQVALNAWANSTGYAEQMPGAKVGKRPKTRIK